MKSRLSEIQNVLGTSGISICFSGRFSQGLIEEIGDAVKQHMETEERPKNDVFNVFSIFVEQSQNIKNYVISKEKTTSYNRIANSAIVCIGQEGNSYFVWSGNVMENCDVEQLQRQLNSVVGASKDELKKLYKEQLKREFEPGQTGAGVGLIDIAKRASQPLEFSIDNIDENFSLFELKVNV
ncbi:MAG: SiaB family protein kinase [Methylococcaceae bacterium]